MKLFFKFALLSTFVLLFFASCKKDPLTLFPSTPIANAGKSQSMNLPICTVTLTGSGTSANGKIVGYIWSLTSGPNVPVIESPSSPITVISGLTTGTYIFQFAVIDSIGLTGVDTVSVVVNPSLHKIVTLQPAQNAYEGDVNVYAPNTWIANSGQFYIEAWTAYGLPYIGRTALKFDFTIVPANAIIDSAFMYLYSDPYPINGNKVDAQFGSMNGFNIQRITSNWSSPTLFTWNNQPQVSLDNKVFVPASISSTENTIANVTKLVKDQQNFGNNGFFMSLDNEVTYNIRQYASSNNSNAALHPKLVIYYH